MPGIREKMLTQQLREMETSGLVERTVFRKAPPLVEYWVTEPGVSLGDALAPLVTWGKKHGTRTEPER